jgi:hypothetical protein
MGRSLSWPSRLKGILYKKGNPKELRAFARLWSGSRRFYSPVIVVPVWTQVKVLKYGPEIYEELNKAQFKNIHPYTHYKNFWHPIQGRSVYILKEVDSRTSYKTSFSPTAVQIPSPETIIRMIPNLSEVVKADLLSNPIELLEPKSFTQDRSVELRFLPWNPQYPSLFAYETWWHFIPNKDRCAEVGVDVDRDMIMAAVKGELNIFSVIQNRNLPGATTPPEAPAMSVPLTAAPAGGTPWKAPTPSQVMGSRVPPELQIPGGKTGQLNTPSLEELLHGSQGELDVPILPTGTPAIQNSPPPTKPVGWACLGLKFNSQDPICVGSSQQQACPHLERCKMMMGVE